MRLMSKSGSDSTHSENLGRGESQSQGQEEAKHQKLAQLVGGGQNTNNLVKSLQGLRIGEDPTEREVFFQCPPCQIDVFDSGL